MRRIFAITAALGFAGGAVTFFASFFGLTLEKMGKWLFVLHGGTFLLVLAVITIERAAIKSNVFFSKLFNLGKARWVVVGIRGLFVLFIINFVLFLLLSRAASPEIRNGQYVLDDHGKTVRPLTETEYLKLKGWEVRMFASGWMCFYSVLGAYWWFPRTRALILTQ